MKITSRSLFIGLLGLMVIGLGDVHARVRVVTSFYPVYVAALNVTKGINGAEVHNMAGPHIGCLHDYRFTAGDARKLSDADLLVVNGAGMESFVGTIREQYPRLKIVEASANVPLLDGNPHVWVAPDGARAQVDNIARALAEADPANAARYAANAAAYDAQIAALDARMKPSISSFAGISVVALHDFFPYLAKALGFDMVGVIESGHGREPDAAALARFVDMVRDTKAKFILTGPQSSDRLAQTVARETGARILRLDPAVTGPSDPDGARGAWLAAMEKNLGELQEAVR